MSIRSKLHLKDLGSLIVEEPVDYGGHSTSSSEMRFPDACLVVDALLELVLMG